MKQFVHCTRPVGKTTSTCCTLLTRIFLLALVLNGAFFTSYAQRTASRGTEGVNVNVILANPAANLDQGKNEAYTSPLSPMQWVNGNLNANQSHYIEQHSVAYRLVMTNLTIGEPVILTMGYDLVNGSKYAIDFLTGYQQLQPHNFTTHGTEETVIPQPGAATSEMIITLPSYLLPANDGQEGVANARASFLSLPPEDQKMYLWGGTLDAGFGVQYTYRDGPTTINEVEVLDLTRGETKVEWTVRFIPTSETATLAWGGHIAHRQDWGVIPIRSAGGISGSPYHMRTVDWNIGNLGNQDRSLQIALAAPVCPADFPTPLSLCYNTVSQTNYPAGQCPSVCAGGTLNFRVPDEASDPTQSTYAWSVSPSAGVTINPAAANTQQVSMTFANAGVYTVSVLINNNSGIPITCTQQVTIVAGSCTITPSPNNSTCPGAITTFSGPAGPGTWAWSVSGNATIIPPANTQNVSVQVGASCLPYTLSLTFTNSTGCASTCTLVVQVTDVTPPVFTFCPQNANLGCNPTEFPPGTPTATDNCGTANITGGVLGAPVNTSGCTWTRTRTWTATDVCGNTATCTQVFTYTIDVTPPVFTTCPANANLGCNPTVFPPGTPIATDNCGGTPVITGGVLGAPVNTSGCTWTRSRTWTATDVCGNTSTCTQVFTYTIDATPPVFTSCPQNATLGCNPTEFPPGTPIATDNCGGTPVITGGVLGAPVNTTGCTWTRSRTWTATDACGNTATCTQVFTYTIDATPPVFTFCPANANLGCNPTVFPPGTPIATDNCGGTPVITGGVLGAPVNTTGCTWTRTRTWTATDACGNTSTCTQVFTYTIDVTPPVFTFCPGNANLGCNPTEFPPGTPIATDNCGGTPVITGGVLGAPVNTTGCTWTRSRTWTATDACGNTSTCTQVFTYTIDVTPPVFTFCPANANLGCNPTVFPPGTPIATDNCGGTPVITGGVLGAPVNTAGCTWTRSRTWTATDACGNTSTCTQVFTYTIDVTPPVFTFCPANANLGCNPTVFPPGTPIATDNCGGTPVITGGELGAPVNTSGCTWTRTRTWTATDACGNTSTCTQVFTYTIDVTPPVFTFCPANANLGCNPTVFPPGTPIATDNCGGTPVITGGVLGAPVNTTGCTWTRSRTWTATDACGNTSTCTQVFTYTIDVTPPVFTFCPANANLGCNPTVFPPGTPIATDNCGGTPVITGGELGAPVNTSGCTWTRSRTWTATDACGNTSTCTQVFTYTIDVTPPVFTFCPANANLGCNPTEFPPGTPIATDNCGGTPVITGGVLGAPVNTTGCTWTRTRTWTATDACGNTSTCTQVFTYTIDVTPPVFTFCPANANLGCNPTVFPPGTPIATDNCGGTPVITGGVLGAPVNTTGCTWTRTRTWTATDACGNTSTCTQVFTYTIDVTPPVFTFCPANANLGCNPTVFPPGTPIATDNCGGTPVITGGELGAPVNTAGCTWTRSRTWTATDACGNTSTCTQVFTYTIDVTPPVFTFCPANANLGCNPTEFPPGTPIATDNCGGTPVITGGVLGAPVNTTGCTWTRSRTWTATDACGNTSTCTQVFTYTIDVTPPVFTFCPANANLGCNPTVFPPGTPIATDNCGGTPVITGGVLGAPVNTTGCTWTRSRTWTATDACGNTSTCTQVFTYTIDVTPPVFTFCPANANLGCNPTVFPPGTPIATDNCGGTPVITGGELGAPVNTAGCTWTRSRTWTATDACGNTSTCTQVFTYTIDVTPPVFTFCPANANLGCNPTEFPPGTPIATDNCGGTPVITGGVLGAPVNTSGCTWTRTRTWTATDACGNTSTCTQVFTYTIDVTPPVFTFCPANANLGCNPTVFPPGTPIATDNCGGTPVITGGVLGAPVNTTGCTWTRTRTWTATDACGNTSTCTQVFTYTIDATPPVFTFCPANANLGCNPTEFPPGTPIATDNCGGTPVITGGVLGAPVNTSGCTWTRSRTWTATDACGNTSTCTQVFTYTIDVTPPVFTFCPANANLGCNPTEFPPGTPIATDNCGGTPVITGGVLGAPVNTTGCTWTRSRTWTATDACGNTSTCTQVFTYTIDVTPPVFTFCPANANLGCNPTVFPPGTPIATDNCGGTPVITGGVLGAPVNTTGCTWTRTRTWTATDACGNTSTCTQVFTYTIDVTPPVFTFCPANANLGCNPTEFPPGTPIATDNCGGTPVITGGVLGAPVNTSGCTWTRSRTWTATDACGNTSTCTQVFTYTIDVTPPVFTFCPANANLGCNPTVFPPGTPIATDNCGGTPVITGGVLGAPVNTTGCTWTRTRTWTATDACGNTSTCTQVFTYTIDVTPPVFTFCPPNLNLGCNPTEFPVGIPTATDNCGGTPVITGGTLGAPVNTTGCTWTRSRTWTATDACGNTTTCTRVFTYIVDVTPPVRTNNPPTSIEALCGTTFPTLPWQPPTFTDNCGTPTVTIVTTPNEQQNICPATYSRTWTATDGCGNTTTFTQTITVPCCTVCTYTQGAYGTAGGNGCILPAGVEMNQQQIMINALDSEPGDFKVFGRQDLNRYWVIRLSDVNAGGSSNIFKMLPGGTSAKVFQLDTYPGVPEYSNAPSWPVAPLKENNPQKGKILNQLFSQTLTLYFNLKNNSNLGGLVFGDSLITADTDCGSNTPIPNTEDTVGMPHDVAAYLAGPNGYPNTVGGLFQLANDMLGGVNTGLDLEDVKTAVDNINNAFDNCRVLIGYIPYTGAGRMIVTTPGFTQPPVVIQNNVEQPVIQSNRVEVSAHPNPFTDRIRFEIKSPISGKGVLEVYNMNGAKIDVVYSGLIYAGKGQVIEYNVPNTYQINMFYVLRVGDQMVTGKLLNVK